MVRNATIAILAAAFLLGISAFSMISMPLVHAATNSLSTPTQSHIITIRQTVEKAKKGEAINSQGVAINSTADEVKRRLGEPDQGDAEHYYYDQKRISLQLKNDRVVWITSTDQRYDGVTVDDVKQVIQPTSEASGEDAYYLRYQTGQYELEFAFYYDQQGKPDTLKEVYIH